MPEHARKAIINYGGIELEVYQLPDGSYTLSRTQVALAIDQKRGNSSVNDFLNTNSPEAVSCKELDNCYQEISIGEGFLNFSTVHPSVVLAYWTYYANKGNNKAISLLQVIYTTSEKDDPIFYNYKGKNLIISPRIAKTKKQKNQSFIYLIQAGNLDVVKIGFSTSPKSRLKGLQTSHYEELKIVAIKKGTQEQELKLHTKFKDFHIRGEWFTFSDEIKLEFDLPLDLDRYLEVNTR